MKIILCLLIIILLLPTAITIAENNTEDLGIQRSANFYSEYINFFNVPPNYTIYNNSPYDNSMTYQLFINHILKKEINHIISIPTKNINFITNKECNLLKTDIITATEKLQDHIIRKKQFPLAIKIDDCYIDNSDFMNLLAQMIKSEFENNKFNKSYKVQKKYFSEIINWNSNIENKKYVEFTMDYESDRPVFSNTYTQDKLIVDKNATSIGINPKLINKMCAYNYCTYPEDYEKVNYTSNEVAWYTAIKRNEEIIFPDCYPYCGVIEGTPRILNNFIHKYGFPMTWHMTGDSIIAINTQPELLIKIKELKNQGLLDLGLHTMYHTNIGEVSSNFTNKSLTDNYQIFTRVLEHEPTQFRAPYLSLPQKSYYEILKRNNITFDNEVAQDKTCILASDCNYVHIPNTEIYFIKLDWKIETKDDLLNIYLSHPWEILYETEGTPIYLKESEEAENKVFKKWLYLVGNEGLIPITPKQFVENRDK